MTWSVPFRWRDEGAWTITGLSRSDGGTGAIAATSIPGGITSRLGHPPDRVEAPDDLGPRLLAVGELLRRLAADVRAEVVHHRFLRASAEDRELQRLRHEREPEGEVEHVRLRQEARERAPLPRLPPEQAPCESSERSASGSSAYRLNTTSRASTPRRRRACDVRPRDAGGVDRADGDAEWASPSRLARRCRGRPGRAARAHLGATGSHPARFRH